jgi:hypothetical protein
MFLQYGSDNIFVGGDEKMNESELGRTLREMYDNAPKGYQVANIHLFGIKYASIILDNNYKISDIIHASGINKSYVTEVSKGIKLAQYVVPK